MITNFSDRNRKKIFVSYSFDIFFVLFFLFHRVNTAHIHYSYIERTFVFLKSYTYCCTYVCTHTQIHIHISIYIRIYFQMQTEDGIARLTILIALGTIRIFRYLKETTSRSSSREYVLTRT